MRFKPFAYSYKLSFANRYANTSSSHTTDYHNNNDDTDNDIDDNDSNLEGGGGVTLCNARGHRKLRKQYTALKLHWVCYAIYQAVIAQTFSVCDIYKQCWRNRRRGVGSEVGWVGGGGFHE